MDAHVIACGALSNEGLLDFSHLTVFAGYPPWDCYSAVRRACGYFTFRMFASAQRYCSIGLTDNSGSFRVGASARCIGISICMWFRKSMALSGSGSSTTSQAISALRP